ncbi:hypothetical protein ACQR07_02555 [Bradyrhizobium sp. HKCCYLS20291]
MKRLALITIALLTSASPTLAKDYGLRAECQRSVGYVPNSHVKATPAQEVGFKSCMRSGLASGRKDANAHDLNTYGR